jgi:hypothetical protein
MTEKLPGNAAVPRIGPPISCLPLLRSSLPPRLFASTKGSPMHKGGGNVKVPVNFLVPGTSTGASFNFGIFLENSSDDHSLFGPSAVPEPFLTQRALMPCCDPQQSTRSSCVHCFTQAGAMRANAATCAVSTAFLFCFTTSGPLSSSACGNMAQQVQPFLSNCRGFRPQGPKQTVNL